MKRPCSSSLATGHCRAGRVGSGRLDLRGARSMWDAERYEQFSRNYSRPFLDLLAHIQREDLRSIVDLGCGPGDLTRIVAERWPRATVIGLDSSPEMLQRARSGPPLPRLTFLQSDIATWHGEQPVDL